MKHFLRKTGLFISVVCIGILFFTLVVHLIIKQQANFELPKETDIVIFGHSHPACSFNNKLNKKIINLAKSGEGYFYNYQKIKEVLPNNDVDVIFIEYTNNQIHARMDNWIWGNEQLGTFLPWHTPFISKEDLGLLYQNNKEGVHQTLSTSTLLNFSRIATFDYSVSTKFGGYYELKNKYVEEKEKEDSKDTLESIDPLAISKINIKYLEKIVNYCNEKKVEVFFIRSPQHKNYPRQNEALLFKIKDEKFKEIPFLDFDTFPLKDEQFADIGHINKYGADVFTTWFNKLIDNGLISASNKPLFIENELQRIMQNNSTSD